MALGKATVNILANLAPLKKGLISAKALVSTMVKSAGSAIKSGFSAAFRVVTAGLRKIISLAKLAALAMLGIGAASVKIAADAEEADNLFTVAMGSMTESAQKWVSEYSKSLGLFETNTKKALGTFQLMLTSMGLTEEAAFDMSKGLVEITNDIASLRNLSLDEAFTKIRAGIVGESEPLKAIGILINETTIKNMALKDSTILAARASQKGATEWKKFGSRMIEVKKSTTNSIGELTQLEKVMLRYKALVKATQKDQGDFKRTIDSTSNVFKIIKEQILITANTIGQVFTPQVTEAAIAVRDWLTENQGQIEGWAIIVKDAIGAVIDKLKEYFELAKKGDFKSIFEDLGSMLEKLSKSITELFIELAPVALDLGKSIGRGFWEAVKDTPLGSFLKGAGEIAGIPGKIGEAAAFVAEPLLVDQRTVGLTKRTQERVESGEIQRFMLEELRRLNKEVSGQNRERF